MAAISKSNDLLASIDLFATNPEKQQEAIANLSSYVKNLVQTQVGCASSSVNRSLDGERVMCYLQWHTADAYKDFIDLQSGYSEFDLLDSHVYEVAVSQPEDADLTIQSGRLLHLGEFRLLPENQPRLVALEAEIPPVAFKHPDILSVNFHRSLDGTRTMNYGLWSTLERFNLLLTEDEFAPIREYWRELAETEFHLYEVVNVFEG